MTAGEKITFLKKEFIPLLKNADPAIPPLWGKMNFQQMTEHLVFTFQVAAGTIELPLPAETDLLKKMKAWLMTEKPFRENTKNPLLPEVPEPAKLNTVAAAISSLQIALIDFFAAYENDFQKRIPNPVFGPLNFAEQVQLCYKHATHHLRQFGITPLLKAGLVE